MTVRKDYRNEQWVQFAKELNTSKDYYVSNYGYVKSVDKITGEAFILKSVKLRRGHIVVTLSVHIENAKRQKKTFYIQKLVAEIFCENNFDENTKTFIIHLDGDLSNNFFLNLKYVDQAGLVKHLQKYEKGLWERKKKKKRPNAKLTKGTVCLIKKHLKEGSYISKAQLARDFNISTVLLRRIEKDTAWSWVECEYDD